MNQCCCGYWIVHQHYSRCSANQQSACAAFTEAEGCSRVPTSCSAAPPAPFMSPAQLWSCIVMQGCKQNKTRPMYCELACVHGHKQWMCHAVVKHEYKPFHACKGLWLHSQAVPRTSKISVAPGGISPRPAPRAPYASSDGIIRVRFPPSCSSHSAHQHAPLQTRHCSARPHHVRTLHNTVLPEGFCCVESTH